MNTKNNEYRINYDIEIIQIKDEEETNNNDEEREEISDEEKQIIIKNDYEEHIYKIKSKYRIKHFDYSIKITKTIWKDIKEIDKRINSMKEKLK